MADSVRARTRANKARSYFSSAAELERAVRALCIEEYSHLFGGARWEAAYWPHAMPTAPAILETEKRARKLYDQERAAFVRRRKASTEGAPGGGSIALFWSRHHPNDVAGQPVPPTIREITSHPEVKALDAISLGGIRTKLAQLYSEQCNARELAVVSILLGARTMSGDFRAKRRAEEVVQEEAKAMREACRRVELPKIALRLLQRLRNIKTQEAALAAVVRAYVGCAGDLRETADLLRIPREHFMKLLQDLPHLRRAMSELQRRVRFA